MYENKKVIVIIGAAGSGKRMGSKIPKQYLNLGGKTILETAAIKFNKNKFVDEIILVANEEYIEKIVEISHLSSYNKVKKVVPGGKERQDSIFNGISVAEADDDSIILIHDGARPFVSDETINGIIEQVGRGCSVVPGTKVKDTIRQVIDNENDSDNNFKNNKSVTLKRDNLYSIQTPQGFPYGVIKEAYIKAFNDQYYGTDDASLVERMGLDIQIIEGDYSNIKITTKEDLPMDIRVGNGYDVHKLVQGRKLILGGIEIPYEKGLLGHSDADVLTHALMDSLLGAAGLGDIGKSFPDNSIEFKDISSLELLKRVVEKLYMENYSICNVDIILIAEKPKISSFIFEMKVKLSETMGIDVSRINIKGTTTEKLGFEGRGEGIAAQAVCLLNRK